MNTITTSLDATQSGMQIAAALVGDATTARKVNLLGGAKRDLYGAVATKVQAILTAQAADCEVSAFLVSQPVASWLFNRANFKPATMTIVYGATSKTFQSQFVDNLKPMFDKHDAPEGTYGVLVKATVAALQEEVPAPIALMEWLADTLPLALEQTGGALTITSGVGTPLNVNKPAVATLKPNGLVIDGTKLDYSKGGDFKVQTGEVDWKRSATSMAASYIQSFDARIAQLVEQHADEYGVQVFSVFDSFASSDLNSVKAIAFDAYREALAGNPLMRLHDEMQQQSGLTLPLPPIVGDFDITTDLVESGQFITY